MAIGDNQGPQAKIKELLALGTISLGHRGMSPLRNLRLRCESIKIRASWKLHGHSTTTSVMNSHKLKNNSFSLRDTLIH